MAFRHADADPATASLKQDVELGSVRAHVPQCRPIPDARQIRLDTEAMQTGRRQPKKSLPEDAGKWRALSREMATAAFRERLDRIGNMPSQKPRTRICLDTRQNHIGLSTKSQAFSAEQLVIDLNESLESLESDYIDLYSLESPKTLPSPTNNGELYSALEKFKEKGLVRHTGIATDNLDIAQQALESGLYEVIQFPFNMISSHIVADFVKECAEKNVGFIAMQPLNGGVITNIPLAFGFLSQFESVIPIWGAHTLEQMNQILFFNEHPPVIDEKFHEDVERIRNFFN